MRNIVNRFVIQIIFVSFVFFLLNVQSYTVSSFLFPAKTPRESSYGLKMITLDADINSDVKAIDFAKLEVTSSSRIKPVPQPENVWAVYSTGWAAGHPRLFRDLMRFIDETCINSLVVDVKDDSGAVSYYSEVPLVQTIGAWRPKMDPRRILQVLKDHGVYPIARIVVFKDPMLAEKRPELAVKNKKGEVWRDHKGLAWVDPGNKEVWDYNIQIAKEAIEMGFPEVQFDYVRFTSDGQISECVYPFTEDRNKARVIQEFLAYAREEMGTTGAILSADIFGLVCSNPGDLGIGQNLEKMADAVEVLSPMVYPSHYYKGTYGIKNPDAEPYLTVYQSLQDAQKRLKGSQVEIRPWLQDFSLASKYERAEILAQIKAAKDAGVHNWLFWNPSCRYNSANYPSKNFSPEDPPPFAQPIKSTAGRTSQESGEAKPDESVRDLNDYQS